MSEVNWDENAKAAVREFAEYVGQTKHYERYLERIVTKQTKTVADAVGQEGEKWTHEYMGDNCVIACSEPDKDGWICILREDSGYDVVNPLKLKPIKPTISTKEYDMLAKYAAALNVDPAQFEQYMSDNYESKLKD